MAAAVAGAAHAAFSLYWAVGGDWLTATLGERVLAVLVGKHWLLFPIGLIKAGFAVLPLLWLARARPVRRLPRLVGWSGAVVLVLWGGVNTVIGNLVLSGLIRSASNYDRPGVIGHAWLWDPLFLIWGVALTTGLIATRHRPAAEDRAGEASGRKSTDQR